MYYKTEAANNLVELLSVKLENEGLYITKPMARAYVMRLSSQFYYNDAWTTKYGSFKHMLTSISSEKLYEICKNCKLTGYRGL